MAAGRRFGKTILACVMLFVNCLKTKDGLFWYVSPTYKQTKQIAWKILLKLIPAELLAKKPNETELSFVFKNGTELYLKGADNPDSLRGTGLNGLVIDEYASIRNAKSVWEEVLRPALADKLGWCFFIGTPKGKNAFWEIWMKGQRKEDGYESWQFKTEDNPFIERSEIKAAKESLSERYFRQEWEASFEDYMGLIWPEFEPMKAVIEPFDIPGHWTTACAIDTAVTGTTGCLFGAIDEDGTIFITAEYYKQNVRAGEVSDEIRGRAGHYLIDPAAKHQSHTYREGKIFTLFDEFLENGVPCSPAENDVDGGINRVAEYFKAGRIKIFSHCKNLLYELERYHWSEEKETEGGMLKPKPFKALDHLCDCLRYLVMSRPSAAQLEPMKVIDFSEKYFEDMEERQSRYEDLVNG